MESLQVQQCCVRFQLAKHGPGSWITGLGAWIGASIVFVMFSGNWTNKSSYSGRTIRERVKILGKQTPETPNLYYYAERDLAQFTSNRLHHQDGQLPRVLMYSCCDTSSIVRPGGRNFPGNPSEVFWKYCYAHLHGFAATFASIKSIQQDEITGGHRAGAGRRMQSVRDDPTFYIMMRDVLRHLSTGQHDYVFVMKDSMVLNDVHFDFPVWQYDLGHDITVMDQFKTPNSWVLNGILFRANSAVRDFVRGVLTYEDSIHTFIQDGHSAFLEMMLSTLGLEAEANGKRGYHQTCWMDARLSYYAQFDDRYNQQIASYGECFFKELERLAGPYGGRDSKFIGFSPTYIWRDKVLQVHEVSDRNALQPLSNCFGGLRQGERWQENCFAFNLNDRGGSWPSRNIPKCPAPDFAWEHFYGANDLLWFRDWPERSKFPRKPPRVLIYTWCSESALKKFENAVYLKECYAHLHGYDVVFSNGMRTSNGMNVTGSVTTSLKQSTAEDALTFSYSDELRWAWNQDVRQFLFSGKYDYVLVMGADMFLNPVLLDFPVWAYDEGHDVTFMDFGPQAGTVHHGSAVLLKPTDFTRKFLDTHYARRQEFWILGDDGALMETILTHLSQEAEKAGRPGYQKQCEKVGTVDLPAKMKDSDPVSLLVKQGKDYSMCFLLELLRLAGPFGDRKSQNFGFSKLARTVKGTTYEPDLTDILASTRVMPWANCFSEASGWSRYGENCFMFHANILSDEIRYSSVPRKCPSPSFDWGHSTWNHVNRGGRDDQLSAVYSVWDAMPM